MFHTVTNETYKTIQGEFNVYLVVISVAFACIASYTALSLNERSKSRSFINRNFWILLAAIAMAFGIWSMHYMGMFAYSLPIKVQYSLFYTIISMIPILVASYIAFYIINLHKIPISNAVVSSVFISLGVATMHLLGMASMITNAHHSYNVLLLICALIVPFLAFFLLTRFYAYLSKSSIQLVFGIVIGLSVSAAHYLCILAMKVHVPRDTILSETMIPYEHAKILAISLTIGLAMIVMVLLIWGITDTKITKHVEKFDTVTHLPNSHQLVLDFNKKKFKQLALWKFQDIDMINKTYGFQYGDQFILQMVNRMQEESNRSTIMYRITQDQILLATEKNEDEFFSLQKRLENKLRDFVEIDIIHEMIKPNGICAFSNLNTSNAELLKHVTTIIRIPQIKYDMSVILYNPAEHNLSMQDDIIRDIDHAMQSNHLFLVYQPKLCTKYCKIVGVEALIRWHHDVHGFISPGLFVPLLEKREKMGEVTNWVIEQVCKQVQIWKRRNISFGSVAINIPGHYLISEELRICLQECSNKYGVLPNEIELEITETSFVQNLEQAMRAVQYYNELGYGIALDDFGTGLSSLSYLRQMQITILKVDKSFIDRVPHYTKDVAIAKTIIALGESLNLQIVVEGIENQEQLEFVMKECQSPIVQGYYFAKPLFVDDLEEMIENTLQTNGIIN